MSNKPIKVELDGDLRRFRFASEEEVTYENLTQKLYNTFKVDPSSYSFSLSYGNGLSMKSDHELLSALSGTPQALKLKATLVQPELLPEATVSPKAEAVVSPKTEATVSPKTEAVSPPITEPAKQAEVEPFLPILKQDTVSLKLKPSLSTPAPVKHNASCDVCENMIVGMRWKCGHCLDYDVCDSCEKTPFGHPNNHLFIKVPVAVRFPLRPKTPLLAPVQLEEKRLSSKFISDITFPDQTRVEAGSAFLKSWEFENNGGADWPSHTELVFVGGDFTSNQGSAPVGAVAAGERVIVSVPFFAPVHAGRYITYWKLSVGPEKFGHRVWCDINVKNQKKVPTPAPTPEPVQATPEPVQATPEPVQATPEPVQATPEPVQATPEPVQATPEPVEVKSEVQTPVQVQTPVEEQEVKEECKEPSEKVVTFDSELTPPVTTVKVEPDDFRIEINKLVTMGFGNRVRNMALLSKHNGCLQAAVEELCEDNDWFANR